MTAPSPSGTSSQREAGAGAGAGAEGDLAQNKSSPLKRGEQAATAMEANLTNLESKLDALLAAFESLEEDQEEGKGRKEHTNDGGR
ncbi:hypothetical protein CCMA1212_001693 [Trichoderma ghanense]|uniref:EKC/KEOPS complex subunit GON7 n=1 Tax=Trichoderma ghanense TaxID=65468 RepID=A0ABY2HCL7_9HYPO